MNNFELNHHEIDPTRSPDLDGDGARVLYLLNLLVIALVRTCADDPRPDIRRGTAVARWEDDDYVYLESNLPRVPGSEIDINFHEGRVFIRIER